MLITQLGLTLCDPMACSLPGSSVHGILQVRTMECTAISSSRGSYLGPGTGPRSSALWADSFFIIWVTMPFTEWMLSISWFLQNTWKAFFSKAFLELLHHMLTATDSEFCFALTIFFSVFIVLSINHLKQTVSSWKLKMNLFIFPLHLMSLFLTHWRTITWLQKVLIDLLS